MRRWHILAWLLILPICSTTQAAPFLDNGNDTVNDQGTGLIWQKNDDDTPRTWQAALDYCNGLTLGGSSNWRLPNVKELRSIVDEDRHDPAIDPVFTGVNSSAYWSATTSEDLRDHAWIVSFYTGSVGFSDKSGSGYVHVRCVR
jgi:hypothetical protein